jgi:nucleoside-diphosphate-sugar epimerase
LRLVALGGTRFIGRAIVVDLLSAGHDVMVVHRGNHEPADLFGRTGSGSGSGSGSGILTHLHCDRADLANFASEIAAFRPDGAIEVSAMNGAQADAALSVLPSGIRLLAISSCDVYRAYGSLHSDTQTDAVPIAETAPIRENRFVDGPEYENLEVEERYLAHGAVILRLVAIYGPHDYQRRQDFILRRIRAQRRKIPFGTGNFLFSRCYVDDVAFAARLAIEANPSGEVFNVAEKSTLTMRLLAERIIEASGAGGGAGVELVNVEDSQLPRDLRITAAVGQHLLIDSMKIREVLGWSDTNQQSALERTVAWDLQNPPDDDYLTGEWARNNLDMDDFGADDEALATAAARTPAGTAELQRADQLTADQPAPGEPGSRQASSEHATEADHE